MKKTLLTVALLAMSSSAFATPVKSSMSDEATKESVSYPREQAQGVDRKKTPVEKTQASMKATEKPVGYSKEQAPVEKQKRTMKEQAPVAERVVPANSPESVRKTQVNADAEALELDPTPVARTKQTAR